MAAPDIKVEVAFDAIKVKFGTALHLRLVRSRLLGLQAWRRGDENFAIEYTLVGGVITCEYDDEAKWLAILAALDTITL